MSGIHDFIQHMRIIDGHEHLATSDMRRRDGTGVFGLLHYLDSDLASAGMPRGALTSRSAMDAEQKAAVFLDYWQRTKNTAYARLFRQAMEELYGMRDWTVEGLVRLDGQVRAASADPDWYRQVLVEKSGIDLAFTLIQTTKVDRPLFRPIMFLDFAFRLRTLRDIQAVETEAGVTVHTLRRYLQAIDVLIERYVAEGMVATKLGHAYWRTLACGKPTAHEAEAIFNRLMRHALEEPVSQEESRPLQDYLIHHIIRRSAECGLPIQIHTGHQEPSVSANGNALVHSQVASLIPLLLEYREARFVLLHCGFPYSGEYLSIAKNFPNVYMDFTWVYMLSPTAAKQIMHQAIEMVPQSKIQGFGGDYNFVEGTYAHLKLARRIVGEALTEKVAEGGLDEDEAIAFAKAIFRNNLIDLYGLDVARI